MTDNPETARLVAKAILILWDSKQLSTCEIGKMVGAPESYVSTLNHQARSLRLGYSNNA
ncbi:MAG: hypothetical protein AAF478_03570 [Pseudomonadota bacterium]